jgi:hypothetical protein
LEAVMNMKHLWVYFSRRMVLRTVCEENWSRLAVSTDSIAGLFRGGRDRAPAAKLLESVWYGRPSAVLGDSQVFSNF